jgi:hypothetical protein
MSIRIVINGVLLILLFLSAGCKTVYEPVVINDNLWSPVHDGIRFRIWTDKTSYQEEEDIWLQVEFENASSQARVVLVNSPQAQMAEIAPLYDVNRIEIRRTSSSALTFEIEPLQSNIFMVIPILHKLLPGQKYREETNLFAGFWNRYQECYQFDPLERLEPSYYSLQATYSWDELPYATPERQAQLVQMNAPLWTGSLKSNTVAITVTAK